MTERDLFLAALDHADPAARAVFLDRACAGDAILRGQVEELLRAHEAAGSFLEKHPAPPRQTGAYASADEEPASPEAVGSQVGPYRLLQKLGEGGMGAVWVAEQTEPVKRRVALKVIKPGMDSAQVLRRFEAERQALAMMDHQNIAKVFDAGTTDAGRPYFVMELVHGVPITRYCDELNLSIRERLELFVPVCNAIQHAHQKGIIHRDVKPSNVLVCMQDGKPIAKVIDFGVAKALHQRLTEQTLFTEIGAVVGTVEYMAPEQAEMSPLGVDTRADVYGLGVLLYELLTGSTPLDRKRLRRAAYAEMMRIIKEEEPPRPSTRLSESKESLPSLAAQRRTEPAKLAREVRGELDWIVMRALEKDRTRRYETATGLGRDVQRYLADEPVEACPPSRAYRLRKLVRKNRAPVAVGATIATLLLLGVLVSTFLAMRAMRAQEAALRERDAAEQARQAEEQQREQAEAQRKRAEGSERQAAGAANEAKAVLEFLQNNLLAAARPEGQDGGLGKDVTLRKALDVARPAIANSFTDRPLVEAAVRQVLSETYRLLGEPAAAVRESERALELRKSNQGLEHPDTLVSMNGLAAAYQSAGRIQEALPLFGQALQLARAKLGPEHPDTLTVMNNLALAYLAAGKLDQALPLLEQTLRLREKLLGPEHLLTSHSMGNLAKGYLEADKPEQAQRLLEQALLWQRSKLGPEHPDTIVSMNLLAKAYEEVGKPDQAVLLLEQALQSSKTKLGPDHPETIKAMNNLALVYDDTGKQDQALPLFEEAYRLCTSRLGPEHPHTLTSMNNLAMAYRRAGKPEQAQPLQERALQLQQTGLGAEHPSTQLAMKNLAAIYLAVGKLDQAELLFRDLLAVRRRTNGPASLATAEVMASLGRTLLLRQKFVEAEPVLREALVVRAEQAPDDWGTGNTRSLLGGALLGQQKYAEAEPLLVQGYERIKRQEARLPVEARPRLTEALERLVQLYDAWGKPDQAARWRKELQTAGQKKKSPLRPPAK
jgi:serine/threonine protein kinase/tetratricopeptide (TPR) repeat protein